MEFITIDKIQAGAQAIITALIIVIGIAGSIATVGKMVETIKTWRKPKTDKNVEIEIDFASVHKMLDCDKRRLDAHEEQLSDISSMNKAMCKALKALLMHEINGNSTDRLKDANNGLDAFLIDASGGR